ncbi:MAG TPA: endonuclease/exonuclease/phosphatase family protein [Vicinamibacterales bacterium]|nr:endonuclease/exonuclease/phosphatase family protein [Vicinamibacterales bacterium]
MNARAARLFALALIALALGWAVAAQAAPPLSLRVMTYNLRYASEKPPNAWPERRALMRNAIRRAAPDIIGTQEGVYPQVKDLAADLRDYDWIGLGRDGGSRGELMAVFYRRSRFEPVAFDHFWLSDTPEVIGSATWGHSNRRMVSWVRFRDKPTGREFYVWNTHLDHQVEEARQKAAALIRDRLAKVEPSLPLVLTGDFNCPAAGCAAYEILTKEAGLADAWILADRRVNEGVNTFNGFGPARKDGVRIDWILVRGQSAVPRAETVTYGDGGRFPSDHFPVVAQLRF